MGVSYFEYHLKGIISKNSLFAPFPQLARAASSRGALKNDYSHVAGSLQYLMVGEGEDAGAPRAPRFKTSAGGDGVSTDKCGFTSGVGESRCRRMLCIPRRDTRAVAWRLVIR